MRCIVSPFNSCYKNIGSEEYYLSKFDEDLFYLYINSPSIIVGRHQNTYSEINQEYVREHGIDVVRRLSGGGAVYHDHGNLNFGFITNNRGQDITSIFMEFSKPILNALHILGVNAEFSGRNDLVIEGKKISGIAQYHAKDKILLHGTLLFSSDLTKVSQSLNADPRKFQGKGIKSVKSRVTNISDYLSNPIAIEQFESFIIQEILKEYPDSDIYDLTGTDVAEIEKLAALKYSTWEWTYGNSPEFNYRQEIKYEMGILDICLNVVSGIIKDITVYGDYFGKKNAEELYHLLSDIPYEKVAVETVLSQIVIEDYFFGMDRQCFIDSLFSNAMQDCESHY